MTCLAIGFPFTLKGHPGVFVCHCVAHYGLVPSLQQELFHWCHGPVFGIQIEFAVPKHGASALDALSPWILPDVCPEKFWGLRSHMNAMVNVKPQPAQIQEFMQEAIGIWTSCGPISSKS